MKKVLIFYLLMVVFLVSCDVENKNKEKDILQAALLQGALLNISNSEWNAVVVPSGSGEIHLNISGSTNADRVTIETYGDGLISECDLSLDADKKFTGDIVICFTHAPNDTPRKYQTVLRAYKGLWVKEVALESEELQYVL